MSGSRWRERFREAVKYLPQFPWQVWNDFLNAIRFIDEVPDQGLKLVKTIDSGKASGLIGPKEIRELTFELRFIGDGSYLKNLKLYTEGDTVVLEAERFWGGT